jgi:hypothetical protein
MSANSWSVARFVTVTMGLVIGLTFLFGFGNVLNLALKLQAPVFVAPLVAPAVGLTVLGHVGTRHLALAGASQDVLRPARHLLLAASAVTLLLNVADPVCAGQWGKAAVDGVGPLLLIGWAEAGPGLLRALSTAETDLGGGQLSESSQGDPMGGRVGEEPSDLTVPQSDKQVGTATRGPIELTKELVERARRADAEHLWHHHRHISAETLRKQFRVGATTSRALVAVVRPEKAPVGIPGLEMT